MFTRPAAVPLSSLPKVKKPSPSDDQGGTVKWAETRTQQLSRWKHHQNPSWLWKQFCYVELLYLSISLTHIHLLVEWERLDPLSVPVIVPCRLHLYCQWGHLLVHSTHSSHWNSVGWDLQQVPLLTVMRRDRRHLWSTGSRDHVQGPMLFTVLCPLLSCVASGRSLNLS